jgi:hypothetical protein
VTQLPPSSTDGPGDVEETPLPTGAAAKMAGAGLAAILGFAVIAL